ncbi:MAG: M48 family metalloprotease [Zoogloeaceae bacterium]|jgi:predicted Zn-dependent protease|nr:M48 family metalloprotease [Zoogloeaceae bacterium]
MKKRHPLLAAALSLLLALPPAGFAQSDLPNLGDTASADLPWQLERQIGQDIMNQIRQREPTYLDDPEIESYLNTLGGRLVAATPEANAGFYFFALEDPTINAFAMFGGFVGVHSGLILNVQNESELAGVLAHEVSHVTQRHLARGLEKQKQISTAGLLVMALGLLAARSNANVAEAAMVGSSAGMIQAQLGFTRDFEREADRAGFLVLQKADFDPHAMASFFERLQKATRVYENNAPVYLRTHPLNIERIADMQNRAQDLPYRQVPDSFDFHLIRARLLARQGTPAEAVAHFQGLLREKRFSSLAATQYGLAVALERQKDWNGVERALQTAREQGIASPLIDRLAAEARLRNGDATGGLNAYREALARFPKSTALAYGYAEALLTQQKTDLGLQFLDGRIRADSRDARLYLLRARLYAAKGLTAQQHHALAEAYALQGALSAAIEQLELAQKSPSADFYEQSAIDARLRQLKQQKAAETPLR